VLQPQTLTLAFYVFRPNYLEIVNILKNLEIVNILKNLEIANILKYLAIVNISKNLRLTIARLSIF